MSNKSNISFDLRLHSVSLSLIKRLGLSLFKTLTPPLIIKYSDPDTLHLIKSIRLTAYKLSRVSVITFISLNSGLCANVLIEGSVFEHFNIPTPL